MTRRTMAQCRRENPDFDRMIRDVETLRAAWAGRVHAPHVVAHLDEATDTVSFHLHVHDDHVLAARNLLGDVVFTPTGYRAGRPATFHFHGDREHMDMLLRDPHIFASPEEFR